MWISGVKPVASVAAFAAQAASLNKRRRTWNERLTGGERGKEGVYLANPAKNMKQTASKKKTRQNLRENLFE